MSHQDWFKVGGATRGTPRRFPPAGAAWSGSACMGCMALIQTGCQSGPDQAKCGCSVVPCGSSPVRPIGSSIAKGLLRFDGRLRGAVEYGAPAGVVGPGDDPVVPVGWGHRYGTIQCRP